MRLAIALLFAALAAAPAFAQQYGDPNQPPKPAAQPKPKPKIVPPPKPAAEQPKPKPADMELEKPKLTEEEEKLRQRLLLKERFNKGWDVTVENSRDRVEGKCKNEAKKRFSILHPLKRRRFVRECIENARR